MRRPSKKAVDLPKFYEEERMRDVLLLVEHLAEREIITIKFIASCLYDVGSVNIIDQKFSARFLNAPMRAIARRSKGAFIALALKWFRRNVPLLITNWLYDQVSFNKIAPTPVVSEVIDVQMETLSKLEARNQEVRQLRSQVKMLTGSLVVMTVVLGGAIVWLGTNTGLEAEIPEVIEYNAEKTVTNNQ